jgi:hypothetical protein
MHRGRLTFEQAPFSDGGLKGDLAAEKVRHVACDREAEADAMTLAGICPVMEFAKNVPGAGGFDSGSLCLPRGESNDPDLLLRWISGSPPPT